MVLGNLRAKLTAHSPPATMWHSPQSLHAPLFMEHVYFLFTFLQIMILVFNRYPTPPFYDFFISSTFCHPIFFFFQDFVVFNCFRSAPLCLYHVCLSWLHCARIFQSSLSIYSHLHYVLAFSLSSRLLNPRLFIQAKMFPSPQQSDLDNHELTD